MLFEWDDAKNKKNQEKHGISFEQAALLFFLETGIHLPVKMVGEERRFALIADSEGKLWVVIYTNRAEKTRIISARRANDGEEKFYQAYYR